MTGHVDWKAEGVDWEVEDMELTIQAFFFLPQGGPALDCSQVVSKQ
jgi:hypothetical protein